MVMMTEVVGSRVDDDNNVVDNGNGDCYGSGCDDRGGQWWWLMIVDRLMTNIIHTKIHFNDIKTPFKILMVNVYSDQLSV